MYVRVRFYLSKGLSCCLVILLSTLPHLGILYVSSKLATSGVRERQRPFSMTSAATRRTIISTGRRRSGAVFFVAFISCRRQMLPYTRRRQQMLIYLCQIHMTPAMTDERDFLQKRENAVLGVVPMSRNILIVQSCLVKMA